MRIKKYQLIKLRSSLEEYAAILKLRAQTNNILDKKRIKAAKKRLAKVNFNLKVIDKALRKGGE